MIWYRRNGSPFIAIRRRIFYGVLILGAALTSVHAAYTANLFSELSDARERIALLEQQRDVAPELLMPPRVAPAKTARTLISLPD